MSHIDCIPKTDVPVAFAMLDPRRPGKSSARTGIYRVLKPFVHLLAPWGKDGPLAFQVGQTIALDRAYAEGLDPEFIEEVR